MEEVPCLCLVIFLILHTLYVSLINPNSFRNIWEYEPNQCPNTFFVSFFDFKHLIKDAAINHTASSGGILCNASDSLMMQFQNDTFPGPDYLNFPSGVSIDKDTVVTVNGKASSKLKDISTISANAWQLKEFYFLTFFLIWFESWDCYSEIAEKLMPTGLKKFVRYWEVFTIGKEFKKVCHIWNLTFRPLFMASPLFGMSAIGRFHCIKKSTFSVN